MFTGLIEEVGEIERIGAVEGQWSLRVRARDVVQDAKLGDSIAVDGVCLTVTAFDETGFEVGLSPETLKRTAFEAAQPGARVNLERALRASDRLGGHIVQGHVDGTGALAARSPEGDALNLRIATAPKILRFIVEKGYVALDGASLTITDVTDNDFAITLVDYTQGKIALTQKPIGAPINIEIDITAKYIEKFVNGGLRS